MIDLDDMLSPCPLCGNKAHIIELEQTFEYSRAVIQCEQCGLTLDYTQNFAVGISLNGNKCRIATNESPIEMWNRRTPI